MSTAKGLVAAVPITIFFLSLRAPAAGLDAMKPVEQATAAARIGVAILDNEREGRNLRHGDERFAMCSTFKFLAVAAVLHRVDRGEDKLDRFVHYDQRDIQAWAPV